LDPVQRKEELLIIFLLILNIIEIWAGNWVDRIYGAEYEVILGLQKGFYRVLAQTVYTPPMHLAPADGRIKFLRSAGG